MGKAELYSEDVEKIQRDIADAAECLHTAKLELLKHYLVNYILYENLQSSERKDSPIREKLTSISVLLDKAVAMEKKIEVCTPHRIADRQMMRNKDDTKKKPQSTTPKMKYRRNAERLADRTKAREDPNINVKKSKSNKFQ